MGGERKFVEPIQLPNGRKLVTLRDAAQYVVKLSKAEQQEPDWQAAAEVLMLIGEQGGDPMMPHIATLRALKRHKPKAAPAPRSKRPNVYSIVQ